MYLLYPVEYPARSFPWSEVEKALRASGLALPAGAPPAAPVDAAGVRALIESRLQDAAAAPVHDRSGAWEVPDTALPLLEALEAFYQRLYPETVAAASSRNFYYEQLEWLGQY